MKQDKLLKQYFENTKHSNPSQNLNALIMNNIRKVAEKKQKTQYYRNLVGVSCISLGMVCAGIWLLKDYLSDLWHRFSDTLSMLGFQNKYAIELYIFIASIVLFLLFLDEFIRRKLQKKL